LKPINILHIEDDEEDITLMKQMLTEAGLSFTQTVVSSKKSLLKALPVCIPHTILSAHPVPAFTFPEAAESVNIKKETLPFTFITGNVSGEFALNVIKAGVDDFILKNKKQRLSSALHKALEKSRRDINQDDATQKMRESEAKYRLFFESSMDGILLTVTDGQILTANPAACAIFQMTEEEICTAGRFGLADPSDPNLMILIRERQLTGRAQGEVTLIRKDGTRFQAEITSAVFKDARGDERTSMIFRDITRRKETERALIATSIALKQTLNVHEKIMQSSLDVICSIDEAGKFVNVSAACEAVWGYTSQELNGKRCMDLVLEEDIEITTKAATSIMNGIVTNNFENRFTHKDGTSVPMLWSARWDVNDKLMYCIAKNITAQKKLEKAFDVERQRFQDLSIQSPSCMGLLKGPDHTYEMANSIYLQLIDRKDIIGKTVKEVLPELESQGIFDHLDAVYQTGKSFSANEMQVKLNLNGNGELVDIYLDFICQANRNETGDIDGILFLAVDVTEQVLSRKTIEASEKKFRQIVETSQEGIWMIDEENETTFVNNKMCEILEYKEEEMLGKTNLYFKDEEEQKLALQPIERRKKGLGDTLESTLITKSGRKISTQVSTNAILDNEGRYKGALAMVTDITDKKDLQHQLLVEKLYRQKQISRAALEAQEKERNYLGGELHDNINQILAAVKLQLAYCFNSAEAEKPVIKNAQENVELAMSEIRSLSRNLVTHRFCEQLFIPMVSNLVLQLFPPEMVTMNVNHFDETIANEIKLTLYRILQEQLNNIIKHAKARHITLTIYSNKTSVSIEIEDDGVGFDLTQNRDGVGLTNIYNRAESYNGVVDICTQPGMGCKLKAVLPTC